MWSNLPEMVENSNLVHQVAEYLLNKFNPGLGVDIHLEKRIPIAAGLGGGSSNAAVTLRALNQLWDLRLSIPELESIAARFGSDIPYFLHGGAAFATHRGELVQPRPDLDMELLLVNPWMGISSSEAYSLVQDFQGEPTQSLDQSDGYGWLFNRLESGVRQAYPVVDRILNDLCETGATAAIMSGSGSTCFGIFKDAAELQACKKRFDQIGYWTQIVRTISRKEYQSEFEA